MTLTKARVWCDASCKANSKESYIAVVVMAHNDIIAQWTERLATDSSLHAEFFAVYRAVQICVMMRLGSVQIYSDHREAATYAQKGDSKLAAAQELRDIQEHLVELIPLFGSYSVIHIPRKENRAHAIAYKMQRNAPIAHSSAYLTPILPGLRRRGNDNQQEIEEGDHVEEDDHE